MSATRPSLKSLKLQAYKLYGVANTRQLKKKLGKGYDFRRRTTWLEILGQGQSRRAYTGKVSCVSDIWFMDGQRTENNITPFNLPLSVLARRVDEILDKDLYN